MLSLCETTLLLYHFGKSTVSPFSLSRSAPEMAKMTPLTFLLFLVINKSGNILFLIIQIKTMTLNLVMNN